jgi:hypothetical protein
VQADQPQNTPSESWPYRERRIMAPGQLLSSNHFIFSMNCTIVLSLVLVLHANSVINYERAKREPNTLINDIY